jgi:S1-C subfamily serine protease
LQLASGLADWAPYGAPELMPKAYAVEAAPAPVGLKGADGVLVDAPRPGSPAAKVGILPADIIVAVDGRPIKNRADFGRVMSTKASGDPVALRILRDGHTRTVTLTLSEMPPEIRVQTRADVDDVFDASPSRSDRSQARAPGHEMKPQ